MSSTLFHFRMKFSSYLTARHCPTETVHWVRCVFRDYQRALRRIRAWCVRNPPRSITLRTPSDKFSLIPSDPKSPRFASMRAVLEACLPGAAPHRTWWSTRRSACPWKKTKKLSIAFGNCVSHELIETDLLLFINQAINRFASPWTPGWSSMPHHSTARLIKSSRRPKETAASPRIDNAT